ncbi:MAG TPA: GAP family protein [Tahibacter sp.]|uniref:GAP family protein n=1 Tax=Tahibacter sp. TaxID=2056211 RepID=UPI002C9516F9|nr:GAP family protein [Tahibacter sp.]HSX61010.1 GAP family protein [Tahibacter sp.]
METTILTVFGFAVVDAINPSALAVTLVLLTQARAVPHVIAYVAGILATYLALGIALMLGFGAALRGLGAALDHPAVLALQAALGLGLLLYAIAAPTPSDAPREARDTGRAGAIGMFMLGATVTATELVTALPYFAAIAVMTSAKLAAAQWLPLLLAYNAIFIAPPLALLGLHLLFGKRLGPRYAHWRDVLARGARETVLWILALVGFALAGDAIARYLHQRAKADRGGMPAKRAVTAAPLPSSAPYVFAVPPSRRP